MVLALYGFIGGVQYPHTDHIAHFGGLLGGLLAAALPTAAEDTERKIQAGLGLLAAGVCVGGLAVGGCGRTDYRILNRKRGGPSNEIWLTSGGRGVCV